MQQVTVSYRQEPGMLTPMPLLDLILCYHEQSFSATALIDSGAMVSILPFDHGRRLGLCWEEQRIEVQLGGILQDVKAVAVILQTHLEPLPPVKLVFAWTEPSERPVPFVLGQVNFFKQYRVNFAGNDGKVYISLDPRATYSS